MATITLTQADYRNLKSVLETEGKALYTALQATPEGEQQDLLKRRLKKLVRVWWQCSPEKQGSKAAPWEWWASEMEMLPDGA